LGENQNRLFFILLRQKMQAMQRIGEYF